MLVRCIVLRPLLVQLSCLPLLCRSLLLQFCSPQSSQNECENDSEGDQL